MALLKPIKAHLIDSRTPAAEAKLLGPEWAAIREPTADERAQLGIPRNRVSTAFVFRVCGGYRVLVLWQDKRRPFLAGLTTPAALPYLANKRGFTFEQGQSALALAAALAMAPEVVGRLALERAPGAPCVRCNCIWARCGPFDPDSDIARLARGLALSSDTIQRTAA